MGWKVCLSMFQHTCQSPDTLIASSIRESDLSEQKLISLFLPGPLMQQPIRQWEDTRMQQMQTYGALTYHYLSSFPVWPAIILSQLGLLHD